MQRVSYKICVSGAAEIGHCTLDAHLKAKEIGKEIARQGCILMTGATSGMPDWAALGAKEEGGLSIGISPASSEENHRVKYKQPVDNYDVIIYSGAGFLERDMWLMRSSDAAIFICGRIGTLNEFTIAFEDNMPMGILEGTGGTADMIRDIVDRANKGTRGIVYDDDPKVLVSKLIEKIKQREHV